MCVFFLIRPILEARAEIRKIFRCFLEKLRTPQFPSETSWPLVGAVDVVVVSEVVSVVEVSRVAVVVVDMQVSMDGSMGPIAPLQS